MGAPDLFDEFDHKNRPLLEVLFEHDLAGALRLAGETFEKGTSGRFGPILALLAIQIFIKKELGDELTGPIDAVVSALIDAEQGINNPLLMPTKRKRGGNPGASGDLLYLIAVAAAAMEIEIKRLRAEGARPYEMPAARAIARLLHDPKITANTVKKWRERCQSGSRQEDIEAANYHRFLVLAEKEKLDARGLIQGILNGKNPLNPRTQADSI